MAEDKIEPKEVTDIYSKLEKEAQGMLIRDGLDISKHRYVREADIRYFGQSTEVRVAAPDNNFDLDSVNELIEEFPFQRIRFSKYCYAVENLSHK